MVSGIPTQKHELPIVAAGILPMRTLGAPVVIGPPTCGTGGVPGFCIGHVCMSEILAAGFFIVMVLNLEIYYIPVNSSAISSACFNTVSVASASISGG